MISVSRLARKVGLSRTTLLYYDRIGLLSPAARSEAGYRLYGESEVERLKTICAYRDAGLSLQEIKQLLLRPEAPDEKILRQRLTQLDRDIGRLRVQQRAILGILRSLGASDSINAIDKDAWIDILRAAGLSDDDMSRWHAQFERNAPDAHHAFLLWLGIAEDEALAIRARSGQRRDKSD